MNPACLSPDLVHPVGDGVGTVEVTAPFDDWQASAEREKVCDRNGRTNSRSSQRHRPFTFETDRAM